jgi:predicted transposase/invertase (TIGR01784 family)
VLAPNPHDTFIKRIFENTEDAIAFFKGTLPSEIQKILELERLEQTKESFLPKNQSSTQTDILWKIPTKSGKEIYTYLLFEHKSYYDSKIFLQLLGYLTQIYLWQKESSKELVPIIPFVFYHGEKVWDLGLNFKDHFSKVEGIQILLKYIPDFAIELFELEKTDVTKKFHPLTLRLFLSLIQKIRADLDEFRPFFQQILRELSQVGSEAKKVEILEKLLYYLFNVREKDGKEFRDEKIYQSEGLAGAFMTVFDEVRLEGEIKGKLEGKLEDAEKMLKKGMSLSDVLDITGLTEEDLKNRGLIR